MKIEKIKRILRCKKGTTFPLIIAVTLSLMMIFVGISEYLRLVIIAGGVRDAVQSAIITTVNDNYADVYHSVREGYAAGYQPSGESFSDSVNYGNIYAYLDNTLGTKPSGYEHIKYAGSEVEFKVYDLSVSIDNAPLAPSSATEKFTANGWITVEVPVKYGAKLLPPMKMRIKVTAAYTEIF